MSTDGSLLIGGSPSGFDLVVATKAATGAVSNSTFSGTYYSAALENDASGSTGTTNSIDSYYGSVLGLGEGDGVTHQRLVYFDSSSAFDSTISVPETFNGGAVYNDGSFQNMLGVNGQALLQVGTTTFYSLRINLQAKSTTASGVFINPLGVLNAASYAPITNSAAPGEFVSIFGSGLASGVFTPSSLPLPTKLGGVQVMVNGRLAPLSYVGPTQINILVPYATSEQFVTFQVINNGIGSNQVTLYQNLSAPGVFTGAPSGVGMAAVLHANYAPVTQSSPAKVGETVLLYLTGLGSVTPALNDGTAAPSNPLSNVDESIGVDLYDQNGNDVNASSLPFSGLAPGFAGLYQINFTIPPGLASGPTFLGVGTQDAYTSEGVLYVSSSTSASTQTPGRSSARLALKKTGPRSHDSRRRAF